MENEEHIVDDWQGITEDERKRMVPAVKTTGPISQTWVDVNYIKTTLIEVQHVPLTDRIKCLLTGYLKVSSTDNIKEKYLIRQIIEGKKVRKYRK